jgi:hypothetical protein
MSATSPGTVKTTWKYPTGSRSASRSASQVRAAAPWHLSLADWHVALVYAVSGDDAAFDSWVQGIEALARKGRYPSGLIIPAVVRGFAAFQAGDYSAAIDLIVPVLPERERMGGSRAQVDLVEATLLAAYLRSGRLEEARHLLADRRSGPAALPIAGSDMLACRNLTYRRKSGSAAG